jgi:hypothetical protein
MKILALIFASAMVTGAEAATLTYKYQGGELFIVGDVPADNLEPLPTSWFAPSYILIIDEDLLPFSLAGNSIGGTPYDDEFPDGFGFDC